MIINSELIRKYNPCEEGIDNFEYKYPNFNDKLSVLLRLDGVPYDDKMWLCGKILPEKIAQRWSLECAKSVHHVYLNVFPNDTTLSEVFETIEKVIDGELPQSAALSAESTALSTAESATQSARNAVLSAVWSARSAESTTRGAAWNARNAALSARNAARSEKEQEEINISILIKLLEQEGM